MECSTAMMDYALARKNMIDSQIATMGVIDPVLLDVLGQVPRERFVPEDKRSLAYIDEDLALGDGGFLMEPMIFARMVQAAALKSGDSLLCVGDTSGYAAAVLSWLTARVTVRETAPGDLDRARAAWASLGYRNIAIEAAGGVQSYDVVFINGAVPARTRGVGGDVRRRGAACHRAAQRGHIRGQGVADHETSERGVICQSFVRRVGSVRGRSFAEPSIYFLSV